MRSLSTAGHVSDAAGGRTTPPHPPLFLTRRSSRYYRYGGALKYFMLYDFFVLCTCCAGYAFIILSNGYFRRGVGQNTFMFSVTLFFLKVSL